MSWEVGNGNDPYGPDFHTDSPQVLAPTGMMQPFPPLQPASQIFDIAGKINALNAGAGTEGRKQYKRVGLAHIVKFIDGRDGILPASDDVAPGQHGKWKAAGDLIKGSANTLNQWVNGSEGDQIQGATAQSIRDKLRRLAYSLDCTASGAHRMDFLVDMFSQDISRTKEWFKDRDAHFDTNNPETLSALDWATQVTIRDSYNPPIDMIGYNHPDVPPAPTAPTNPSGTPTTMPAGSGPGGPGMGLPVNGLGLPTMPAGLSLPSAGDPGATSPQGSNALNGIGDAAGKAAQQAGQGAQQAGQGAQQAAQQGANAAQQALGEAMKKNKGALPEGALSLGSKGLGGAGKPGGAGGGRAGGAGGARTPGLTTARPSADLAAASKTTASASRAGVSSGTSGAPGAGAPAAGHRGGAADKVHKASKALHHDKHGVISEADAVVQVVGEDPREPASDKSG